MRSKTSACRRKTLTPTPEAAGLRAMRIEKAIEIARSPEDIWAFISDARRDPEWCHKVDSVEQLTGEGPGPSAKYRVLHRPRPGKPATTLMMDVVEYDEPLSLRWREEDEDGVFDVTYRLEQTNTGTRLTQIDEIDWKISKLLYPVARVTVSRDIARQLAALKGLLESASRSK